MGGTVGATAFWRALDGDINPAMPLGCEDIALLSIDHLSPVLAALFFHDFLNKILFGLLDGLDRSASLRA